jgi:hypothetical protein
MSQHAPAHGDDLGKNARCRTDADTEDEELEDEVLEALEDEVLEVPEDEDTVAGPSSSGTKRRAPEYASGEDRHQQIAAKRKVTAAQRRTKETIENCAAFAGKSDAAGVIKALAAKPLTPEVLGKTWVSVSEVKRRAEELWNEKRFEELDKPQNLILSIVNGIPGVSTGVVDKNLATHAVCMIFTLMLLETVLPSSGPKQYIQTLACALPSIRVAGVCIRVLLGPYTTKETFPAEDGKPDSLYDRILRTPNIMAVFGPFYERYRDIMREVRQEPFAGTNLDGVGNTPWRVAAERCAYCAYVLMTTIHLCAVPEEIRDAVFRTAAVVGFLRLTPDDRVGMLSDQARNVVAQIKFEADFHKKSVAAAARAAGPAAGGKRA